MRNLWYRLLIFLLRRTLDRLKKRDEDIRLVYDNPPGTLSFQGYVKLKR